jgi:hypothetical protein
VACNVLKGTLGLARNETQTFQAIAEKWGFGMAPPKAETQRLRLDACRLLLEAIGSSQLLEPNVATLEAASVVKGLFNRVAREDQWDWFTVSRQLGYPSPRISSVIAREIGCFRAAIAKGDKLSFDAARTNLLRLPVRRCLSIFLGLMKLAEEQGVGWLYILSSRELPDLLKIGMTTRTVEQRSQEINAATGVAIPFGVRRCWRVIDPKKSERLVHDALAEYRLRGDREFFRVSFGVAVPRVDEVLRLNNLDRRTLDDLVAEQD